VQGTTCGHHIGPLQTSQHQAVPQLPHLPLHASTPWLAACPHSAPVAPAAANNTWWNIYSSSAAQQVLPLPFCQFGPLLSFMGAFSAPESPKGWKGGSDRRRQLLGQAAATAAGAGSTGSSGGSGVVKDSNGQSYVVEGSDFVRRPWTGDGATAPGAGVTDSPEGGAELAGDGSASATTAAAQQPGWCSDTRWWVEAVPPGAQLAPANLHAAMVRRRLGR